MWPEVQLLGLMGAALVTGYGGVFVRAIKSRPLGNLMIVGGTAMGAWGMQHWTKKYPASRSNTI